MYYRQNVKNPTDNQSCSNDDSDLYNDTEAFQLIPDASSDFLFQNIATMGGGSQVQGSLSQTWHSQNDEAIIDEQSMKTSEVQSVSVKHIQDTSNYWRLNPLFVELLSNIRSEKQLTEASEAIQSLSYKFAADASLLKKGGKIAEGTTTFLGESPSLQSDKSRFKFGYERASKCKKRKRRI